MLKLIQYDKIIMNKYPVNYEIEFAQNPYPGKFVAFEGIDGSGKTTQIKLVVEELKKMGKKIYSTQEPTDEPTGKLIRQILSGEIKVPPVALQYLFNADRAIHLEKIKQLLQDEYIVITDRYFWSSVAYATADMQANTDLYLSVYSILSFYNRFIVPDITVYLNVKPDVAVKRIEKSAKHKDIYDKKEKLDLIYMSYADLIQRFAEFFTNINGDQAEEKVTQEILEKIV